MTGWSLAVHEAAAVTRLYGDENTQKKACGARFGTAPPYAFAAPGAPF
jgi:hypothetical protein